jgi:stearoyl-CoA desaturase (delta-9 desaturase)
MNTKQWVAVHRKHHAFTETENDPHSPATYGILQVLFGGAFLYHNAVKDERMVQQFGVGTPDDTMEKFYSKYTLWGVMLMLWIDLFLFGIVGFIIWGVQMIWIPFWAAGVVNGISHWKGYRNGTTKDNSRNICPIGIIIGGEELHNNHHLDPANPKLSLRWFEFDIGYFWLRIFIILGLARLRDK